MQKEYKYKFSIVMPIYKVEKYLEEAIESVINQTIGFKESVQLILVNDGSPDNSEEICLKYYKKYPKNIEYIKKTNGGPSSARNEGLKKIKGKYVNFMDPDDILLNKVLENVYTFFEKNYLLIDTVSIPLYLFEANTGIHGKYKFMGKKNRVISLLNEPHNFVLSSAASFYKEEIFKKNIFDENLSNAEDLDLNIRLYLSNPYFGYVCSNDTKYMYRQRYDDSSIVSSGKRSVNNFEKMIGLFSSEKNNLQNYIYIKEIIIYQLKNTIKFIDNKFFSNNQKYNEVISFYRKLINFVGIDFIINESKWCSSIEEKLLFLNFYYKENNLYLDDNFNIVLNQNKKIFVDNLSNQKIFIKSTQLINDYFYIDVIIQDIGLQNIRLVIKDGSSNEHQCFFEKTINSSYDMVIGDKKLSKTQLYKFKIKINNIKRLYFYFKTPKGDLIVLKHIISKDCNFNFKYNNLRIFNTKHIISYKKYRFIVRHKKQSLIKYNVGSYLRIYKKYKVNCFIRLLNNPKKRYILIMDRPNDARDNGEAFFKYINLSNKKEKKYVYFVISKNSSDYKRLKKYGKVVNKNSIFHKYLFINSKLIVSSHIHPLFYKAFSIEENKYYADLMDYKLVWLQHGITKDDISKEANKYSQNIDKLIVATKPEYEEFSQDKYFYFEKEIILSGFPRFDYLYSNEKNIITIIPTWRKYLSGRISSNGIHEKTTDITKTKFFENYQKLLSNVKLKSILKARNINVNFILHPAMINYFDDFMLFKTENINIIDSTNLDYTKMFAETKLLITDYSSVFFDFAYLKKPEIFFQFDQDTFFESHYKHGYFSYEKDGFGDVLLSVDEVVEKIEYYINNDFKMEEKYIKRVENTFAYTDKNNCERVYNEIIKLYNEE